MHRLRPPLICLVILCLAPPAMASTTVDLRGDWDCSSSAGSGCAFTISTEDFSSGNFSGTGSSSGGPFHVNGTLTGSQFYMDIPYDNGFDHPYFEGTVSADGKTMSGKYGSQPCNQNPDPCGGSWAYTRTSGPPGGNPNPNPDPNKQTANMGLSCTYDFSLGRDVCNVLVQGGSPPPPSGPVSLATSDPKQGGVFPAGNSCQLSAPSADALKSNCSVEYIPGSRGVTITANYPGDAHHNAATAETRICNNPLTGVALCDDPGAGPAACSPAAPLVSQCYLPGSAQKKCTRMSGKVRCQPQVTAVMACGGLGSIAPICSSPPASVPQVCGTGVGLTPCTGANEPVIVCGAPGGLAACDFNASISSGSLDPKSGGGLTTFLAEKCNKRCQLETELAPVAKAMRLELTSASNAAEKRLTRSIVDYQHPLTPFESAGQMDACLHDNGLTAQDLPRLAALDVHVLGQRTGLLTLLLFPYGSPPLLYPEDVGGTSTPWFSADVPKVTAPGRAGSNPGLAWKAPQCILGDNPASRIRARDVEDAYLAPSLRRNADEFASLYYSRVHASSAAAHSAAAKDPLPARLAHARTSLKPGHKAKLRLHLSHRIVGLLVRSVPKSARVVPMRILVVNGPRSKRPAVRILDFQLRIKGR